MMKVVRISIIGFLAVAAAASSGAVARDGEHFRHPEFDAARRELFEPAAAVESDQRSPPADQAGSKQHARDLGCAIQLIGSDAMTAQDCLACHGGRTGPPIRSAHPVGTYRPGPGLRSVEEVVRRGVLVPGGKIECVTCHDRRSPWRYHLALPPGAPVARAVNARDPSTYENRPSWRTAGANTAGANMPKPPDGSAVSPAPLCAACHTHAD